MTRARPLGFASLFFLGLNGIVGVGIFFTPATIARLAGAQKSPFVVALTALLIAPIAGCFVVLSRRFSEDGGPILYAHRTFGRHVAFGLGWAVYGSALFSTTATLTGLAQALLSLSPSPPTALVSRGAALVLFTALMALAARGLVVSARIWNLLTLCKLLPLVALLVAAAVAWASRGKGVSWSMPPVAVSRAWPAACLAALFTFQGFEILPLVAGQAQRSSRVLPAALVACLAVATLLYVGIQAACVGALGDALARSPAPLRDAAWVYGGHRLRQLVGIGTSVSALGISFGMVSMTPRYLTALLRLNEVPSQHAPESTTADVPARAWGGTWALGAMLLLVFGDHLETLVGLASLAVVGQYALTALSLGALAWRRRLGLTRWQLGWVAPALALSAVLAAGATRAEAAATGALLALGCALRWGKVV